MRLRNVKNAKDIINKSKYITEENYSFKNDKPLHLEIGMGKGKFLIENAIKYPNINFIGIEKFDSVIVRALEKLEETDLNNIKLMRMDATNIDEIFNKNVDLIYLNFSDPWPKDKHEKRRLTSITFLEKYDKIFKSKNHIIMKTDNKDLFDYSVESFVDYGYEIVTISYNLHKTKKDIITTEYEEKFISRNCPIYFVEVIK